MLSWRIKQAGYRGDPVAPLKRTSVHYFAASLELVSLGAFEVIREVFASKFDAVSRRVKAVAVPLSGWDGKLTDPQEAKECQSKGCRERMSVLAWQRLVVSDPSEERAEDGCCDRLS